MATYIVNSTLDTVANDGVLTLREALIAAEANGTGADEIVFDAALSGQTIRLTSGVLTVTSGEVTINGDTDGDGDPNIIISGDKTGDARTADDTGIFSIANGATASLTSLQLTGGYGRGADGTSGNPSGGAAFGAVYNAGTLTITDSIISTNYARAGNGYSPVGTYADGGHGGAAAAGIFNAGTVTVTDTAFQNNTSFGGDGGDGKDENTYASSNYDGGNGGNAGTILNLGAATLNNVGFLVGNFVRAGYGGDGSDNSVAGGIAGNGGNGGHGAMGILNAGTLAGQAAQSGGNYVQAFGGVRGYATNGGTDGSIGTDGSNGYTLFNAGGTSAGFTDLGSTPLIGNVSGSTTIGNDNITSIDNIFGLHGDDSLTGSFGPQRLYGGSGDDTIDGTYGTDFAYGGSGNDTIIVTGGDYFDHAHGGSGIDTLDHSGSTYLGAQDNIDFAAGIMNFDSSGQFGLGVSGIEIFKDSDNNNIITASSGGMTIFGNDGDDTVRGGDGNDNLGTGNDILDGGSGDDTIEGGLGDDVLVGGTNTAAGDTLSFENFVAVSGTLGITVNLDSGLQQNTGAGLDTISGFENVTGSNFDDTISGSYGGAVNNIINGMGGNDTIVMADAYYSADHFNGGANIDTLISDKAWSASVIFDMGLGTTTYNANTFNTFEQIENITVGAAATVIGDGFDNVITVTQTFGAQTNNINGGGGDDTIEGAQGGDNLIGGAHGIAGDTVSYRNSVLGVTVNLTAQTASGGDAEGDRFSGFENAIGSAQADTLLGSSGNNRLEGGAGNDSIEGRLGDDVLIGGANTTTGDTLRFVNFAAVVGTQGITVDLNLTTQQNTGAGLDTISEFENVLGSNHDDTILGDTGKNTLNGGNGNDVIEGGLGNDTLVGGGNTAAGDTVSFANFVATSGTLGITFSLNSAAQQNTGAGLDTISGFENAAGSNFDDTLSGSSAVNILSGGGGNDTLNLLSGLFLGDHFDGGADNDTLITDAGVIFASAVLLDMTTGTSTFLGNTTFTFEAIENITFGGAASVIGDGNDNIITVTQAFSAQANTIDGGGGDDTIEGAQGGDILTGGANGIAGDTVSYRNSVLGVTVSLLAGGAVSGGDAQGDTISGFENVTGSAAVDNLTGNAGNNVLKGLGGGDSLNGGAGLGDVADYTDSDNAVTVALNTGAASGGHAAGDTFSGIEFLNGSGFGDSLTGSSNQNTINGGDGADFINGANNNDTLLGGEGDDTIAGSEGADIIDGGGNTSLGDTASYANHAGLTGMTINLQTGTATGNGHGTGDTLIDIENVIGSAQNDTITGDGNNNVLTGGNGLDTITGGDGDDTLNGQNGDDTLVSGAGADAMNGGGGTHDKADYSAATEAVWVDLRPGGTSFFGTGDSAGDTWSGIEDVTGSGFDDVLIGSSAANILLGGLGVDTLLGSAGADIMNGGGGLNDLANYQLSTGAVFIDLLAGTNSGGHAQGDSLVGIESLSGSNFNDTLTGNNLVNFLYGLDGNDTLSGNGNGDFLYGGGGNDTMNGGSGADRFVYQQLDFGQDVINGWQNVADQLDFTSLGLNENAFTITASGADALLTLNADPAQTIRITGMAGQIDGADFL